ncbi:MAG: glycoside hydrolase family 127 protein [Anaerolineales bacterium]|nr:glycoside hydrolase family 127 protein [Anaerolineales bacterium]
MKIEFTPGYWADRLEENANHAIFHQWEQLEKSGCIDNFRIIAEGKQTFRTGWFFADSDAYKWLDAAARIYARFPQARLKVLMDELIALIAATQQADGYIYTYNQIHFPDVRWQNLQIEHELYCHGHLIEAAVSHKLATDEDALLDIAIKAADRLVADFMEAGPGSTPGHQEIEIALLRLYDLTENRQYLLLAQHFLEQRGRVGFFPSLILRENASVEARTARRDHAKQEYIQTHPDYETAKLPGTNAAEKPRGIQQRFMLNALTGRYMQQNRTIRHLTEPAGHAVRFTYLQTAVAMLLRETGDSTLLPALEKSWDRMVQKRMYVTGGIGSLPMIEGFGRDYELDPKFAYTETCAALGNMFWNWEMTQITQDAKYADLLEWQLYNAAHVGMGTEGTTYFYNNPLTCKGGVTRKAWFEVPCCPSNLSRTWGYLDQYLYTADADGIWFHQYVSGKVADLNAFSFAVEAGLPYAGLVTIKVKAAPGGEQTLHLRIPSWAETYTLMLNGQPLDETTDMRPAEVDTASGYSPYDAFYLPVRRVWQKGDVLSLEFDLPIWARRTDPRVASTTGKVALTRGPLVYCLEDVDNPGLDIHTAEIKLDTLSVQEGEGDLAGVPLIMGQTADGQPFTALPYYLWGNRGPSEMTVYVKPA